MPPRSWLRTRPRESRPMTRSAAESHTEFLAVVESNDPTILDVRTTAEGPSGSLPLTDEMLRQWPSGDLFGLTQNAGMGWAASDVARDPYLILSTQGGLRAPD